MRNSSLKKWEAFKIAPTVIFIVSLTLTGCDSKQTESKQSAQTQDDFVLISQAFHTKQSGIFVQAHGLVGNIFADDTAPPRHQRFVVRLPSGQTLLVAHNIDIAPRIEDLRTSVPIYFRGEYLWNEKGGTVHKTHHDPSGRMPGGWIEYNGKKYE